MSPRHLLALFICLAASMTQGAEVLRLATSTTVRNAGLLDVLLPAFEQASGISAQARSVGSGIALRLGREGAVDALLVHAPEAEELFMAHGYGVDRRAVMHNDFVIVGPPDDPAGVAGMTNITQALRQIRDRKALFLSRGDDSGTHKKELTLWQAAEVDPYGMNWYREMGMGIGKLLRSASTLEAYTLGDQGTWLAMQDQLQLRLLVQGDPRLHNPYHVIAVNPAQHPQVNDAAARQFIDWLCGPAGQQLISDFRKHDQALYIADNLPDRAKPASQKELSP